jgi:hypothetical protein
MTTELDPLDSALRASSSVTDTALSTPALQRTLADLLSQTRADAGASATFRAPAPASGRRRRRSLRVAGLSAAVVIAGTGVAAATGSLHTGLFGTPGMTENDTSEWLDTRSPAIGPLLTSYAEATPLAPGASLQPYIANVTATGAMAQARGLRVGVALYSACTWEQAWLSAHRNGDTAAQAEASHVLAQVPTWPAITGSMNDGKLVPSLQRLAYAATAGDAGPIADDVATNCGPSK